MRHGWYHHARLLLVGVGGPWAMPGAALGATPLLEQWVAATDAPVPGDVAIVTGEQRTDADGSRWIRVLVEDEGALGRRGWRTGPARPQAPLPPGYHDPQTGTEALEAAVARAPRAGLALLGRSVEGRPIEGAWFGRPPDEGEPTARVLADHHGDEGSAWEVALALADRVSDGDGADPAITAWLDHATLWIVPFVNPDGAVAGTRENAAGVDLNRNYDYAWSALELRSGDRPFSEPETRAVRAFGELVHPTISLSLHAGATNVGWPWNYTTDAPPDADLFVDIAKTYAERCTWPGFWLTQGADWYLTRGDTNDWAYGRQGVLDLTVELSDPKSPEADRIPEIVDAHLDALLATLSLPPDASGRLVDARTGRGLAGTVSVIGSRPTVSDPATGRFHRQLPLGADALEVAAPGYRTRVVPLGELDPIALEPLPAPTETATVLLSSARWFALPVADQGVRLVHPGAEDRALAVTEGGAVVDPTELAPGAWSIVAEDGSTWRNRILVVDGVLERRDGADTWVGPLDPAPGTRVFALAGDERAQVEVPWEAADGGLRIPEVRGLDLLVVAGGEVLAADADGTEPVVEGLVAAGNACGTMPGHRGSLLVSMVIGSLSTAGARRRR